MGEIRDIGKRYTVRAQAEHYRDRFRRGRRRGTHQREVNGVQAALDHIGTVDKVLDVGCGPGRFAPVLAAHARQLFQTDLSEHMLDVSRTDSPVAEDAGGYVQADARNLPFASQTVDLVFCHRLLNHLNNRDDRRQMLSELARVSHGHILTSCLGPPRALRVVRGLWRRLTGRSEKHGQVTLEELIEDARSIGLALTLSVPIHTLMRTAVFLIFRIRH